MIISLLKGSSDYSPAFDKVKALEELLCEPIYQCRDKQDLLRVLPDTEVILTLGAGDFTISLDDEIITACENVKAVLCMNAGIENIPIDELTKQGIPLCNTKGSHRNSIAEYAIGGMLAISHNLHHYQRCQMEHNWVSSIPGVDINGKTILIIGAGSIGSAIGQRAKAFDMRVIGIKKHPCDIPFFDQVWGTERLHDALSVSDYVIMVVPLNSETYHMMGEKEFDLMKSNAVFINVGRGDTVDESALIRALQKKMIAGAVLDVFHEEPLPKESPLWDMDQVIITPHAAGPTKNTQEAAVQILYENIKCVRNDQPLLNVMNL